MNEIINRNIIDICTIRWGEAPAPLLPETLRIELENEPLPEWVCAETGLPLESTAADLGPKVWGSMTEMSPRLRHFLVFLLKTHKGPIKRLLCVNRNWPLGLKVSDVPWTIRTTNCLGQSGFLDDSEALIQLTFGQLFKIERMGMLSALDFCCTLEAVIDQYGFTLDAYVASPNEPLKPSPIKQLSEVADQSWSAMVSSKDPRFSECLPYGQGTLQDCIERMITEPLDLVSAVELPRLIEYSSCALNEVDRLGSLKLEQSLVEFLRRISRFNEERLETIAARFGWAGREPSTLEKCGERLGITRERIRQIQNKIIKRIPDHTVFMPKLEEALRLLEKNAPIGLTEASQLLQKNEVSKVQFHPSGILEAARLLHHDTTLEICTIKGRKFLVSRSESVTAGVIPKVARKLAGKIGVSNVFEVTSTVSDKGFDVDELQVRRILESIDDFEFLNKDWFWAKDISSHRNRLCNVIRKMLSVVSSQSVTNIREGVKRVYRWRASSNKHYSDLIPPPIYILREFIGNHPDYLLEGDMVCSTLPLDYNRELGDVERIIVDVLRSSPSGVMDRQTFSNACLQRGVNENTFSIMTSYSCVVDHLGIDIWKLRGANINPAAVEALREANQLRPREKRVIGYGWSEDGTLWVAARIPRHSGSLVIGLPSGINRILTDQKFPCISKNDRRECGTIVVDAKGTSWGYGPFMRRYGADVNDILLTEFDLVSQNAALSIVDDDYFDEEIN
ncbi:MAG: hypothetical protein BMS9Abin08_0474 [Gammaproteobacteria bacterium]|nr:MAG: hypothetical protein BMS9Abin08_0474 [Gammaproteobacteria bacterium]